MTEHEYLLNMKLAEFTRDLGVEFGTALQSDFIKRKSEFEYKKKIAEIEKEYNQPKGR